MRSGASKQEGSGRKVTLGAIEGCSLWPTAERFSPLPQKTHTPFATSVDHTDARTVAGCGTDDCAE